MVELQQIKQAAEVLITRPAALTTATFREVVMADANPTRQKRPKKHPHNWNGGRTVTQAGYVLIFVGKDHPLADVRGYVYEHRLKAWQAGHEIHGKHVHHDDEVKSNNDTENLKPLTPAEHRAEHRKPGSNKRLPSEPNPIVLCACGCGEQFLKYDTSNRPRRYVSGHNTEIHNPLISCGCGCGSTLKKFNTNGNERTHLWAHRPARENPAASCACGCGRQFPRFDSSWRPRRYVPGHNPTGRFTKGHALNAH